MLKLSFPASTHAFSALLRCIVLNVNVVFSAPINSQTSAPVQQSNDVWALVVANVAPLMALIGERNAKEFMRTTTTWHQQLPLSAAPLGILSIMVSAIRLSGPGFLRRLVGRDSERRSEALVELTPLSVKPATSVYTPRAVEIETTYKKDDVAFICGHVRDLSCQEAVMSFQHILHQHQGGFDQDKDMETVLVLWTRGLPIEKVAELADFITAGEGQQLPITFPTSSTAALSYRTTGISPTQTGTDFGYTIRSFHVLRDIFAFILGASLMVGVQTLGLKFGGVSRQTFYMGMAGYWTIVVFTFSLLLMIKGEVVAEKEILPHAFDKAIWTFSDSRHSEHRRMRRPKSNTLIIARPLNVTPRDKLWRSFTTTLLTIGLVGSYVLYYLSMRVAPWWVSLSSLGVIWFGALYRAVASPNTIVASGDDVGSDEHWIGLFRRTLSDSVMATINSAYPRSYGLEVCTSSSTENHESGEYVMVEETKTTAQVQEPNMESTTALFAVHPVRTSLRTWSGAEDVMKVGLEMAKIACKTKVITFESHGLNQRSRWRRIVRLRLAIYVPGFIWRSNHTVYFALTPDFDLEGLIRHVLKLLHICMGHTGTVSMHSVEEKTSIELSHVLCGPIADPPLNEELLSPTPTLRDVMSAIHDNDANATTGKFSMEQALLLPTIILSCIYDRWLDPGMPGDRIEALQAQYVDQLGLSGKAWLGSLESEFGRLRLWDDFMVEANEVTDGRLAAELEPRDATSGDYTVHNDLQRTKTTHDRNEE
jgi:hypothetical protein